MKIICHLIFIAAICCIGNGCSQSDTNTPKAPTNAVSTNTDEANDADTMQEFHDSMAEKQIGRYYLHEFKTADGTNHLLKFDTAFGDVWDFDFATHKWDPWTTNMVDLFRDLPKTGTNGVTNK